MAKRGILDHEKTLALADALGIMDCYAVGILEVFWHWVAKQKPDGNLTGVNPCFVARSIRYTGDAKKLWKALITCHFIDSMEDGRVLVHDWSEHADNSIHQLLKSREQSFADGNKAFTRNATRRVNVSQKDDKKQTKDLYQPVASSQLPEPVKPTGFALVWGFAWRKRAKKPAEEAYRKKAKNPQVAEAILAGVKRDYPIYMAKPLDKRPHMATWLNEERYNDEPDVESRPELDCTRPRDGTLALDTEALEQLEKMEQWAMANGYETLKTEDLAAAEDAWIAAGRP